MRGVESMSCEVWLREQGVFRLERGKLEGAALPCTTTLGEIVTG